MEIEPFPGQDSDQFEFMKSCQVFGAVIEETSRWGTKDADWGSGDHKVSATDLRGTITNYLIKSTYLRTSEYLNKGKQTMTVIVFHQKTNVHKHILLAPTGALHFTLGHSGSILHFCFFTQPNLTVSQ